MLKGYHKLGLRLHSPILHKSHKLLVSVFNLAVSTYHVSQFKAKCSTAFYAFLQVGKITPTSSMGSTAPPSSAVQINQLVKWPDGSGNTVAFKLTFTDFQTQ